MKLQTATAGIRVCLLAMSFLLLISPAAEAAPLSKAMKSLLRQAETLYVGPYGYTIDKMANQDPLGLALFLGVTMQRQQEYAKQDKQFEAKLDALCEECYSLFEWIAKKKGNTDPKSGKRMTGESLKSEFLSGLNGWADSYFTAKFGVDPKTVAMPMILSQVQGQNYAFHQKKKKRKIKLLDEEAHAAEVDTKPVESGDIVYVSELICPERGAGSKRIDSNNNPNDDVYVYCDYYNEGVLRSQSPQVKGKTHGVDYTFSLSGSEYYLLSKVPRSMGKMDGTAEEYRLHNGRPYLYERGVFSGGKRNGARENFQVTKTGSIYRSRVLNYANGKQHGRQDLFGLSRSGNPYLSSITEYFDGKKHGEYRGFTEDEVLRRKELYNHGTLMKYWEYSPKTGQLLREFCRKSNGKSFTYCN